MPQTSIFDLLQTVDTPQAQELQQWIALMFPKTNDRASFLLATQLEKLFEMAIYENQVDTVHLLLQQGVPPNMRSDWGTTPLMWATCLGYTQIVNLLLTYGADQHAKSFSGILAADFSNNKSTQSPEYKAIMDRRALIHAQVTAGYLKPLGAQSSTSEDASQNTPPKRQRQIDNGKGVDELFKQMNTTESKTREINLVFE